jgi:hypothetical protein
LPEKFDTNFLEQLANLKVQQISIEKKFVEGAKKKKMKKCLRYNF